MIVRRVSDGSVSKLIDKLKKLSFVKSVIVIVCCGIIFLIVSFHQTAQIQMKNVIGSNEEKRDICIKCSHDQIAESVECDFFHSTTNSKIAQNSQLIEDGLTFGVCPITISDSLYPIASSMMESEKTIFEQMAVYDAIKMSGTPPKWEELTTEQQSEYLMNGTIQLKEWYWNEAKNGKKLTWTAEDMNNRTEMIKNNDFKQCSYSQEQGKQFYELITSQKYEKLIKNSSALVIGSQSPWLEAILLAADVGHITTSEYANINVTHPKMSWIHPKKMNADGNMNVYDVVASYSSLEHSGLGRYGDPLNPIGDIQMMAQISCFLKPGGLLFLGLPTNVDALQYNAHRIYGPQRLRLMFMQFKLIDVRPETMTIGEGKPNYKIQPWMVLQNKRGCKQYGN